MPARQFVAVRLKDLSFAEIPASGLPVTWTAIDVVHEDSFQYVTPEQSADPYKNEITGKPYFHDVTESGDLSFEFSVGKYDLELKAKMQGGTYTPAVAAATTPEVVAAAEAKWVPAVDKTPIYLAFKATTVDNVKIIFPKAMVLSNTKANKKAQGMAVKAVAETPDDSSLSIEQWGDGNLTATA